MREEYNGLTEVDWFRPVGESGLKLSALGFGAWHNFGAGADRSGIALIVDRAFDAGITYFDLANNYGPPPGHAEKLLGPALRRLPREQLVIATKAGFRMWPGPYGIGGSRKHLLASLDQSLLRLGMDYVDIFFHHCPDPETPLDETLCALGSAVSMGKALYVGISNYNADQMRDACRVTGELNLPPLIVNQVRHNIIDRCLDDRLAAECRAAGAGLIVYSPLAQGLLTGKYSSDIPSDSRAARETWDPGDLKLADLTEARRSIGKSLNDIGRRSGRSPAQLAIAWSRYAQHGDIVASVILGIRNVAQLEENIRAFSQGPLSLEAILEIEDLVRPVSGLALRPATLS